MAYIVTFERSSGDQDRVLVRILDDSTGSFVEETRLEIGYAQYNASVVGGLVSVTNKTTLEALFETQPYDLYRRNTAPYNTWGFDAASTVTMLNVEIGGSATGSSPPPAFMFSNFIAGGNTITPDNTADTLTFTAGRGLSITGNISTDTITIATTGVTTVLGTAPIQTTSDLSGNTTVSIDAATTSTAGSMSAADKTKLDGITSGAAVASVSGTAPISSTGGTTPAISISEATTSAAGSMSAADKTKLDGIAAGAEVNVNADWNAVSGDAQILNKPTIPTQYSVVAVNSTTTYPLVLADANEFMVCDSTSNFTITIPLNSSVPFPTGTEIAFMQRNTGTVTIQGTGGVSLFSSQTARTAKQHAVIAIKKIDTDTWVCVGDRLAL